MKKPIEKNTGIASFGAGFALIWERLWPLLIPVLLVLFVFVGVSWLGLWHYLPIWVHIGLLVIFGAAAIGSLSPLHRFIFPDNAEISRRIEVETQLRDRPINAQSDEMALGDNDAFSRALWHEHRHRMSERLQDLTGGTPKANGNRFDPYGFRLMLPILVFIAFMVSFGANGGRLSDAFNTNEDPQELLARLDVWVNPPTYTKKAPVYLAQKGSHQTNQSIVLPQHSELIGRFVGSGNIALKYGIGDLETELIPEIDESSQDKEYNYKLALNDSGVISAYSGDKLIAQWSLKIIADKTPEINFIKEPDASLSGSLQLNYEVSDDYGVTGAKGLIAPLKTNENGFDKEFPARFTPPKNARSLIKPLEIKLPLPRRRTKSGKAKVNRDISKHPLAGSMVQLTLIAHDDVNQEGRSEAKQFVLPGRRFSDPIAKALIEQRRILALDANQQSNVIRMLDAISIAPDRFIQDYATHLSLKIAYRRLVSASNDDQLRDVMNLMWDIALGIEFGKMSNAERRLRDAQERLSEALENGAGDKEIDKLMKELRQAMNELMQAMKEQALKNPQSRNPLMQDEASRTLRQKDLQNMLDKIEQLAKSGSKEAARELLAEMQRMMDNLQAGRHMQQRRAEGNQTNEALDNLSELMQKQQKLMDETFRMEQQRPRSGQRQNNQGNQNQNQQKSEQQQKSQNGKQQNQQNQSGDNQEMTAQEYADALKQLRQQQRALQDQLSALNQQLEELGLSPTGEFGEAGKQMGEAGKQLGQGEAGSAVNNQGKALDSLRRGAQSMMQQMAGDRQQGGEQQGQGRINKDSSNMRDPLGRNNKTQGADLGFDKNTPGEIDAQKARRILEAIRKRLSRPEARTLEKNYLERLLDNR